MQETLPRNGSSQSTLENIVGRYNAVAFSGVPSNEWFAVSTAKDKADRQAGEAQFRISDEQTEPVIDYPKMRSEIIDATDDAYQNILQELIHLERTPEVEIMIDKVIQKLGELYRYEEVSMALGQVAYKRQYHLELASDVSLETIGGIDPEDYGHMVNNLLDDAEASQLPEAKELPAMVRRMEVKAGAPSFELKEQTIERLKGDILELFPQLADLYPDEGRTYSPEESVAHFKAFLDALWLHTWQVKLGKGNKVGTNAATETITVGAGREPFSAAELYAIMFHEAFGHARRASMAKRQSRDVARASLPGSLDFDEGLSTGIEQVMGGRRRIAGVQYYTALGLQAGTDQDGLRRSYRQTYEIMWRRELLRQEKAGETIDSEKAKKDAQMQVQRTRRGGAIDARDSAYFLGAKKAYTWLNELAALDKHERQAKLLWVLSAVFDPTDEAHREVIDPVDSPR